MLQLRLEGRTYGYIATKAGVSRQRVQQVLSPPSAVRTYIVNKASGKCTICGILVGVSGNVHHFTTQEEDYNDIDNLQLLCSSCHRTTHVHMKGYTGPSPEEIKTLRKTLGVTQAYLANLIGITETTLSMWEKGKEIPSDSEALTDLIHIWKNPDSVIKVIAEKEVLMEAEEIKTLRKNLKLTQKAFAKKLKVVRSTVIRWEQGQKHPSRPMLARLRRLVILWLQRQKETAKKGGSEEWLNRMR